jgi:hypothetical protein
VGGTEIQAVWIHDDRHADEAAGSARNEHGAARRPRRQTHNGVTWEFAGGADHDDSDSSIGREAAES